MIRTRGAPGWARAQQTPRAAPGGSGQPAYNRSVTHPLPSLILYGRHGCHLCEEARWFLDALLADRVSRGLPVPALEERSIEGDDELQQKYALTIPVVVLGDHELELATTSAKLRRFLAQALGEDEVPVG